ncbi:MAG: sensor histidine kinase N-terminal domain-containing protein [Pseudomonadaceae bacterium]|nr:sensor histidine kinase N-terminal domain-containing protein [Pseudomonadaceae bacterium]
MLRSIRARTLVLVLGVLSVSMMLMSYKSYRDANHEIEELFDAQLAQSARLLQGMVGRDVSPAAQHLLQAALDDAFAAQNEAMDADDLRAGHPYESKMAFQLLDNRGQLLLQSASAPNELLAQLLMILPGGSSVSAAAPLPAGLAGYHDVPVGAYHWRVFLLHDLPDQRWILVGEREDVRGELVGLIARRILLPQLLALPILALLIWLAIGWGLGPLAQMASFIKSRAPDNLAPLLLAPLPRELEPMVAALNRLLQQIAQLLAREQRFLADAAHELRTPLAVLRIHAQNAQQAPDPIDRANALLQLGNGVERATRVVTQLLTLARLEPAAVQLSMSELDFAALLRQELAELTPLALARQQELELQTEGDNFQLVADAPSLGTLLQNLVGNAVQYTPTGGRIRVCLEAQPGALLLRVQDSGPGVSTELREKLFERFFRQGMGQGAGLGLSIVQRVVELHGGSIELHNSPFGGLEVLLTLPRQV